MEQSPLDSIFKPGSIAVIGASERPGSVGGAVLGNLRKSGFQGRLFGVNSKPRLGQADADSVYGSLSDLPLIPDLVVVCTPAPTVPALVRECGRQGVKGMIIISAGFRESGPEGRQLESALKLAVQEFPNLRFLGPNCLGVLKPANKLNASFSPVMPLPGRLTFLSQSGALCTAILDWSLEREIGFATCVSVGNMTNVGMGDLIDYFADDDQTDAILLYLEGIDDAPHFIAAARACSRRKPVIAYKAGRFSESSAAAASHTGAIATSDAIYQAAFRRAGIERVQSIEELFDCAKLLIRQSHPAGDRLAIVTNAGGPGVMASDAWLALGGQLARLTGDTLGSLSRTLPSCWSHGNPVDVLGDASADRFETAIDRVIADPNVDALLVIVTPQTMTEPERVAKIVVAARAKYEKPIVASWIGGSSVESGRVVLKSAGVPSYDFPEEAIQALHHLVSAGRIRAEGIVEAGKSADFPDASQNHGSGCLSQERRDFWHDRFKQSTGLFDETFSKEILSDYGIPVVASRIAASDDEAVSLADELGYPVVLKVVSPEISHKTDVGGVALNLANAQAVRDSYALMMETVQRRAGNARITGVSVQRMVSEVRGIELLLGLTRDSQFGPLMLIGAGGITTELQKDTVLELPPFDERTLDRMLHSLRISPLLYGYRGRPGVNLPLLRDVMVRFARLADDFPEIVSAEINPLHVSAESIVALDARIISSAS